MEKKYRATARCFCCHHVLSENFSQISIGLPTWKKTFILSFSAFLRSCSRNTFPPSAALSSHSNKTVFQLFCHTSTGLKHRGTVCHRPEEGPQQTRFLPGTAPARPEHTEIYIVQRPHSILLLGNKVSLCCFQQHP